jgi:hypothetical protein
MRHSSLFVFVFALVALVLGILGRAGPLAAQDAPPPADGHGLVGSWRGDVTFTQGPPSYSVGTLDSDGTIVVSIPPVMPRPGAPGDVLYASSAYGAWEATGADSAIVSLVGLVADGQGNAFGAVTIRASVALDPSGETFSGSNVVTITDVAGHTVATRQGTIQGTRIVAEAPAMATPAA